MNRHSNLVPSCKVIYSHHARLDRLHITLSPFCNLLLSGQRLVNPFNDARVSLEDRQRLIPSNHEGLAEGMDEERDSEKEVQDFVVVEISYTKWEHACSHSITLGENRLCQRYEERVSDKLEMLQGVLRFCYILQKCFFCHALGENMIWSRSWESFNNVSL